MLSQAGIRDVLDSEHFLQSSHVAEGFRAVFTLEGLPP